jgi:class 3 adenylate cyclase
MALHNSALQASLLATIEQEQSSRELSETLSHLLPTGLADCLRRGGLRIGQPELLEITVLMSDIRGYSGIAETIDAAQLAAQLNEHRRAMNDVIKNCAGIVMQYMGDAVFAVLAPRRPLVSTPIRRSPPPMKRTRSNSRLTKPGRAEVNPSSAWASAFPPGRSRQCCLARTNVSNTPWWETPSTWLIDCRTSRGPRHDGNE